ncbi:MULTISPECIES: MerR family transcriptional regulator [Georgenia]|nr:MULTISPECIES: MerR family transcriptional regulator [Georgenia]
MSATARRATGPEPAEQNRPEEAPSTWPPGASTEPTMSIGAVLAVLQPEFPAVRISKLRFLEEQGLVSPRRSGSGYRMYSQADVERLRYALTAQRDSFLPLRVIRDQLEDLDAGRPVADAPGTRVVTRDGELVRPRPSARVRPEEIADLTGVSLAEIEEIAAAGLIVADPRGRFPGRAVDVVQHAATLARQGISPRHLRTVRTAAERHADTIEQVVAPVRAQRSGAGRERAAARALELAEVYGRLHADLLRAAVDDLA